MDELAEAVSWHKGGAAPRDANRGYTHHHENWPRLGGARVPISFDPSHCKCFVRSQYIKRAKTEGVFKIEEEALHELRRSGSSKFLLFGPVTVGRWAHHFCSLNRFLDNCSAPHGSVREHLTRSSRKRSPLSGNHCSWCCLATNGDLERMPYARGATVPSPPGAGFEACSCPIAVLRRSHVSAAAGSSEASNSVAYAVGRAAASMP
jgi:hypothetical protein